MVIRSGIYEEITFKHSPKDQAAASPARSKRKEGLAVGTSSVG